MTLFQLHISLFCKLPTPKNYYSGRQKLFSPKQICSQLFQSKLYLKKFCHRVTFDVTAFVIQLHLFLFLNFLLCNAPQPLATHKIARMTKFFNFFTKVKFKVTDDDTVQMCTIPFLTLRTKRISDLSQRNKFETELAYEE